MRRAAAVLEGMFSILSSGDEGPGLDRGANKAAVLPPQSQHQAAASVIRRCMLWLSCAHPLMRGMLFQLMCFANVTAMNFAVVPQDLQ